VSDEESGEEEPFIVRIGAGPPLVLVRIELAHRSVIVPAELRPDVLQTTVARSWANALELSVGQGAMIRLARRPEGTGDTWGPCELVTLLIDDALDSGPDRERPSVLLGRDFLHTVWVTYLAGALVMITRPPANE
jgi:hypothetical protein